MENWKRTFALIWSGQLISILSSSVVGYAIIFWMSLETGSPEVLALATMSGMLPQALLGLFIGVYIDRWDRKLTMICADGFIALCTLLLAVLFYLGVAEVWHVYLLLACRSIGSAFHMPAMQASIPLLAPEEQLTRIAGVNQMISSLANIVGPALGALFIGLTSIGNILLFDVVGAFIASLSLLCIRIPRPPRSNLFHNLWREFREGLTAIGAVSGLAWLFTLSILVLLFIMPVGTLYPLMTLQHFGGGTFEMSLIEILWGGSSLLGGALMSVRNYPVNRVALICFSNIVVGLAFALSGLLSPTAFVGFALLTALEGVAGGIFNASFISIVQSRLESGVLGRVLSLYFSVGQLPAALGLLGTGFLAEEVGIANTFIVCGVAILLLGTVGLFIPNVLRLGRQG